MSFSLNNKPLVVDRHELAALPGGKKLINTVNAYSYVMAQEQPDFAASLMSSDALIPDGMSIVWASRLYKKSTRPSERISGWDLFELEMDALNSRGGKCFFMGCDTATLAKIAEVAAERYPNITVESYSPPFKDEFSEEDNRAIIDAINTARPDLLWIGLSAPKQETWVYRNWNRLDIDCHVGCIGAVFSFFAGKEERAPHWVQRVGMEWLYRLAHNPRRLWRRYLIGNARFVATVARQLLHS